MKKIFTALLISIVLLGLIPVIPATAKADEGSTVRVWFSQYEYENEAMREIAGEFTAKTGIKVEIISGRLSSVA